MDDPFSTKEILIAVLGSGGIISGLVTVATLISGRLDKKRQRLDEQRKLDLSESTEFQKLKQDDRDKINENLWKIIEDERKENEALRDDLKEAEKHEKLARPTISRLYRIIRDIRKELESVNIMVMGQDETNVFMTRWNNLKLKCDELENLLSGDEA